MKKALQITKTVLVWLVVAVAIGMMIFTLISVSTFDKTERNLFGFKFFIVTSDSMSATDFDAGDIAISKNVDPKTLKEGDIITFLSQDPDNFGEVITHKIRRLTTDANGHPGFVTYGTTTDTDDRTVVTHEYVVGQYVGRIPKVGSFFMFLKTTPGYILCILLPFLLLILSQGLNCIRLFRQYKKEQMDEMKVEREKIEQERAESQRMMAELLELKAQLAKKDGEATPPADPAFEDSTTDETE
ncbi:MAG: signal peptidase I [Clostridia bacterium]|nr:signal peptidase I [Clostridia bacterium]